MVILKNLKRYIGQNLEQSRKLEVEQRARGLLDQVSRELGQLGMGVDTDGIVINTNSERNFTTLTDDINSPMVNLRPDAGTIMIVHEIGHAIHYAGNKDIVSREGLVNLPDGETPSIDAVREHQYLCGLDESIAMLLADSYVEDEESINWNRDGFGEFYKSPRHALGFELSKRLRAIFRDRGQKLDFIARVINQDNKTLENAIKIDSRLNESEWHDLLKCFETAVGVFYKEMYL